MLCCRSCTATCTCRRFTGGSLAAVFGKKFDQRVHVLEARAVDNEAPVLAALRQSRARQAGKMERQRGGRQLESLADGAGGHAPGAGLDQQAKDRKAGFLRQRREGLDGLLRFHVSRIVEMSPLVKPSWPEAASGR